MTIDEVKIKKVSMLLKIQVDVSDKFKIICDGANLRYSLVVEKMMEQFIQDNTEINK